MRLRVRSKRYKTFGGREVARGDVLDTRDFPDVEESKFRQLVNQAFLEIVEEDGSSVGDNGSLRHRNELDRARRHYASPEVEGVEDGLSCDACDFVAKNEHGLRVHRGRRHTKE